MICAFKAFSKAERFNDLVASVQHCDLCPRLCGRRRVLSPANGSLDSKILFVAEAPGRLGADRTGVPLHGDRTGDNFEALLGNIGWTRDQVFITNAILCNPQQHDGTNGTPTAEEIGNCSAYLEMVIALLKPDVVVTLGATALNALELIAPHGIQLQEGIAKLTPWRDTRVFPLYHPGPRAMIHRSMPKQRSDFMLLAKAVHPIKGLITRAKARAKAATVTSAGLLTLQQAARAILELGGQMPFFKLTKLLYLVDLAAIQQLDRMVAGDVYLRQVDGPWLPKLDKAVAAMDGHEVRRFFSRSMPFVALGPAPRSQLDLDDEVLEIIADVFAKYGAMSNAAIKTAVYRTPPMQFILREESSGKDMRNKPVLYKGVAISEAGPGENTPS